MKENKDFFYWLIIICLIGLGAAFAQNVHFWEIMNAKDATKITWLICGIFPITSLVIGAIAYRKHATSVTMERLWFIADAMITLGMIGTVSGFLILAGGDSFSKLNPADTVSLQKTMQIMGTGMGTILVVTLMGLISSVLLKLQLVIIHHFEVEENNEK